MANSEGTESPVLKNGKMYRGCIITDTVVYVGPSVEKVKAELEGLGFTDVQIWDYVEDLPADWTEYDKRPLGSDEQAQFWGRGKWSGKDDQEIPTSGDKWTLAWMYEEASGSPPKFEQEVHAPMFPWIPVVSVVLVGGLATLLWAKSSKE